MLNTRSETQKVLEPLRTQKIIGSSLEAKVSISANGEAFKVLKAFHGKGGLTSDLRELLIVSEVELKEGDFKVVAQRADGQKCVRCWVYSQDIGTGKTDKALEHLLVCPKCLEAL